MKEALATGSEARWRTKTGPEWIREKDGNYRVTLVARPAGKRNTLPIRRVWVYITGVTDHHQNVQPQTMARIAGTDVWRWSTALSANWRGSYCFIPTERDDVFAAFAPGETPDRNALREGWRQLLPQAIADPLNSRSWREDVVMRFQRWKCRMRPSAGMGSS